MKLLYFIKMEEITACVVKNNPLKIFFQIDAGKRDKYC